jgi:hypothetical protein
MTRIYIHQHYRCTNLRLFMDAVSFAVIIVCIHEWCDETAMSWAWEVCEGWCCLLYQTFSVFMWRTPEGVQLTTTDKWLGVASISKFPPVLGIIAGSLIIYNAASIQTRISSDKSYWLNLPCSQILLSCQQIFSFCLRELDTSSG